MAAYGCVVVELHAEGSYPIRGSRDRVLPGHVDRLETGEGAAASIVRATDPSESGPYLAAGAAGLAVLCAWWAAGPGDAPTRPLEDVAGSFTHLHVNRMLRGALRTQELVIYDLLDRWYRAMAALSRR